MLQEHNQKSRIIMIVKCKQVLYVKCTKAKPLRDAHFFFYLSSSTESYSLSTQNMTIYTEDS